MKFGMLLSENFRQLLTDDAKRVHMQFLCVYACLALISLIMTAVNCATRRYELMEATLIFSAVSIVNCVFCLRGGLLEKTAKLLFSAEITALFCYFLISGEPEGFSAIWITLLPASGMFLFGRKFGVGINILMFCMLVFFLWIPFGQTFLQYSYTSSFKLRFPFLFLAFGGVGYVLETVRAVIQEELIKARNRYLFLSTHDELTGVYNRFGFNSLMVRKLSDGKALSLAIGDLDHFKHINDRFGHTVGDIVLRAAARELSSVMKGKGDVCRWGGEEFALLFYDAFTAEEGCHEILERFRRMEIPFEGGICRITISLGLVTTVSDQVIDQGILVRQADKCLYASKTAGRDRLTVDLYKENDHWPDEKTA